MSTLTIKETRMLSEAERMMDSGQTPYVILNGERVMTSKECLADLGIKPGQTINSAIFVAMINWSIADCEAKLAMNKAAMKEAGTDE